MAEYIESLQNLAEQFGKLGGVGRKSALRMAFSVLDDAEARTYEPVVVVLNSSNDIVERKGRRHI